MMVVAFKLSLFFSFFNAVVSLHKRLTVAIIMYLV